MHGSGYRTRLRCCSLRLVALLLGIASPCPQSRAEPNPEPPASPENSLPQTFVSRSHSSRFQVSGTNRLEVMDLTRWADTLAIRIESTLKLKLPAQEHPIRITILPPDANESASVTRHERYEPKGLLQWLLITGYETVPVARVQEELVHLLLASLIRDRRPSPASATPGGTIPDWFTAAVIHNLTSESRDQDYLQVSDAWRAGNLPSMPEYLAKHWRPDAPPEPVPVSALLLQWILAEADAKRCLDHLWPRFRNRTPITAEDLIPFFPGATSPASLDLAWDDWLLKQRHRVRIPGQPSPHALEQLEAQLLLYPADSAIGVTNEAFQPIALRDLVKQHEKKWVPSAAAGKAIRLRLLGAGRDGEFREVVNAYGAFLDALAEKRSERALTERLEIAEQKLNAYKERLRTQTYTQPDKPKETP
jgi:hypothetical protein